VCLGSDGCLYVTQNGGIVGDWRADELLPGQIQRVSLDTRRVCRLRAGGPVEQLAELDDLRAIPDGLAVAADGSLYIAVLFAGGLQIVGPDGSDRGKLDVGAIPSNCTFRGNSLFVTDGGSELGTKGSLAPVGRLWRAELEAQGLEPFRGRIG